MLAPRHRQHVVRARVVSEEQPPLPPVVEVEGDDSRSPTRSSAYVLRLQARFSVHPKTAVLANAQ